MTTVATNGLAELLRKHRACSEAQEWARDYDTLDAAWAACERGDWMLWLSGRMSGPPESDNRKRLVLCACACARAALKHVRAGEERPLRAIETAERWARGEAGVTLADVRSASYAAYADAAAAAAYVAALWRAMRSKARRELVDLVREHYPTPPQEAA